MENPTDQSRFISLETRLLRSERWAMFGLVGWLVTASLILVFLFKGFHHPQPTSDTIRVHRLVVLDEAGRERIVIASPLPDHMVNGEIAKRRNVVSAGIQFKDPDGTERGGIAALDDGSLLFGIDDERGRERAHLYYIPKRGSGVYLQGEKDSETISLLIPQGGTENPKLEMTDQAGKPIAAVPSQK